MSIVIAIGLLVIGLPLLAVTLIIGMITLAGAIAGLWLSIARTERTVGEIAGIEKEWRGRGARVRVAYHTPAGRFEVNTVLQRPRLGDQVPVRYSPRKPARATTGSRARLWRTLGTAIAATAVIAALSAGMVTSSVWTFAGSHRDLQISLGGGSFVLAVALFFATYVVTRVPVLLRWNRMVTTEGKLLRYKQPPKGADGPGSMLIAFQAVSGEEEFWATAGTARIGAGDTVTVYYDPAKPARSATVQDSGTIRAYVIYCAVLTLVFGGLGVFAITQL